MDEENQKNYPEKDQEELKLLFDELYKESENGAAPIESIELKKRVAKFMFKLVDDVEHDEILIQEKCYTIAGFLQFEFNDELDEIMILAGELELPTTQVSGDVFEMFDRMKGMLRQYISKR